MPEYIYRAVTSKGQVVRNRVEAVNKNNLVRKLKNNDLLPISIVQVGYKSRKSKANRRNIMDIDDIMKQADAAKTMQGMAKAKPSLKERVNLALSREEKITTRDIVIFIFVGLVVAVLYVLIANMLDTTIKSQEDVERVFKVPVLAAIPINLPEKGGRK